MILERPVDLAFWAELGVEPHPVCPLPDEAWLRAHTRDELIAYLLERQEVIDGMLADPLHHGWEPPTWRILDALCGFPWVDSADLVTIEGRRVAPGLTPWGPAREWALMVRRKLLRQDEPIKVLLLNGGNRAGKSEWAASRVMRLLLWKDGRRAWCFHQDISMSRDYQQALLYKYLPADLRTEKGIKRNPTYIAYKQQTGFSDEHFVLPNRSDCDFRTYEQNFRSIQGGELDVVWCDELVPASWVKELKARVATRGGWLLVTFTPVEGYTTTVKAFLDVARPTVESWAFVLPKDGQPARRDLALRGEDPIEWLRAEPRDDGIVMAGQAAVPAGRKFDKVPRVMRCVPERGETYSRAGVFFFHSFDNPFGNPGELFGLYSGDTEAGQKMRFYGLATKAVAGKFPKFGPAHIVKARDIPTAGTRFQIVDPCSGRNFAMAWVLVDVGPLGKRFWFYREWPCPGKYVPGVGDMGAWAEPGDKLDGERGPAQASLGWGLLRVAQEILRLEGKKDWESYQGQPRPSARVPYRASGEDPDLQPDPLMPRRGGRVAPTGFEEVYERIMDSRFGNAPTPTKEGLTTLIEQFREQVDLEFVPASGSQTTEDGQNWIHLINDLLDYDENQPIGPLNAPQMFFSEECANLIFAMQNWTGEDGKDGACKDFVDLVKYAVLHDCDDWSDFPVERARRERRQEEAARQARAAEARDRAA